MINPADIEFYKQIESDAFADSQNKIFSFQVMKMMQAGYTKDQIILELIKLGNEVFIKMRHCIEVSTSPGPFRKEDLDR